MRAAVLAPVAALTGLCAAGCTDSKAPLPIAPPARTPAAPLTPAAKQKVLGKWERETVVFVERIEFKADGTVEWLQRLPSGGPMERRTGLGDRPVTFRFKGDNTIELLYGGSDFTEFKDVRVTDDKLEVMWLGPMITYTRVK